MSNLKIITPDEAQLVKNGPNGRGLPSLIKSVVLPDKMGRAIKQAEDDILAHNIHNRTKLLKEKSDKDHESDLFSLLDEHDSRMYDKMIESRIIFKEKLNKIDALEGISDEDKQIMKTRIVKRYNEHIKAFFGTTC